MDQDGFRPLLYFTPQTRDLRVDLAGPAIGSRWRIIDRAPAGLSNKKVGPCVSKLIVINQMNNRTRPFIYKEMSVEHPKELPGGLTIVNKEPENDLGFKPVTGKKIAHLLKKAVYKKRAADKKKTLPRGAKYKDWIMPPAPEQFIKSKNNDPL